jgi:hypothetical protein
MSFADPAHPELGRVDLTARPEQNGVFARGEQRAVERGGLPGDQLGTKCREVTDVLVFPDQEDVCVGAPQGGLCLGNPFTSKLGEVISIFPVDGERPLGVSRDDSSSNRMRALPATMSLAQPGSRRSLWSIVGILQNR